MLKWNKMRSLVLLFGVCLVGCSEGRVISIDSPNPSCMLEGESTVTIQCEIVPTSPVTWKKNSSTQTTCDNTADDCIPERNGKNTFTSNIIQNLFLFNIANVTLGTDDGLYVCETTSDRKSIQLEVCKVPTSVSIDESGSDTVNLTATSDCAYLDTNLTFKWFYVSLAASSLEEPFDATQTTATDVSDCTYGAKKVSNSIQHTQPTSNRKEVNFLVKVSHPKLNETIVNRTSNTYYVEGRVSSAFENKDTTETQGDNKVVWILLGCIGTFGLLIIAFAWYYSRNASKRPICTNRSHKQKERAQTAGDMI